MYSYVLATGSDAPFSLAGVTAENLRKIVLANPGAAYYVTKTEDEERFLDHHGNVYRNYQDEQSFSLNVEVGGLVFRTERPSNDAGALYAKKSTLPLESYINWREQVYYLTTTLTLDADFEESTYHLFGDDNEGFGTILTEVVGILRMQGGLEKTITMRIDMKLVASEYYKSEILFTLTMTDSVKTKNVYLYYEGKEEGELGSLYINLEELNLGTLRVDLDIVTPIADKINDGRLTDPYQSLGEKKLSCGCSCEACLEHGDCYDGDEHLCSEGCTCKDCVLSCGCTDPNCLKNRGCYDEYGVRICDGIECGCECEKLSCGCTNPACLTNAKGCDGGKLCRVCTSRICQDLGECCFIYGICDYADENDPNNESGKTREACTCSHCRLHCGCTDPACLANGGCYHDGVLLCAEGCDCDCTENAVIDTKDNALEKWQPYLDSLLSALQIGNKMGLVVLNPNVYNNLLLMMGYETFFCDENFAHIKAELDTDDMTKTYLKIASEKDGVYDISVTLSGFEATGVVYAPSDSEKTAAQKSTYNAFETEHNFKAHFPNYQYYPTADKMEIRLATSIDI